MAAIGATLRERMAPLGAEIFGREMGEDELRRRAHDARLVLLARWPDAPEGTTPAAHLEQIVDSWAEEMRRMVRLSCWDVLLVPIFAVLLPMALLSVLLPDWAAIPGGFVLGVPLLLWWFRLRRSGRWAFGDD